MRAITIRQPWATAVALAAVFPTIAKLVENRDVPWPWRDAIGERVAIHAGKGWDADAVTFAADGPWLPLIEALIAHSMRDELRDFYPTAMLLPYMLRQSYPAGVVLATALLVDVHDGSDCACESRWAQPDQWHLVLDDVELLKEPVPARGALGWWQWEAA